MSKTIKPKEIKTDFVYCVTSGKGFVEGCVYAQVGWNNGVHILRETEQGDVVDELFCTGGIGKGLFNAWDDSGSPSFNPIAPKKWKKGEWWIEESEE